jgi:hypothetical protein
LGRGTDSALRTPSYCIASDFAKEAVMVLILLWLLGVPLGLIVLLWLLGVFS